jgi:predicted ribosome quality control (RQC) complex YloA/Tae2 family protein
MKTSTCIAVALALSLSPAVRAQSAVQRCESKDGSVTYSNTDCPPGSTAVRKVNTDPPVSIEEKKAAQERARKDDSTVKQIEKEHAQEQARAKREADQRAKTEAKAKERCERARRDLQRAKTTRAELAERAATVDQMQKADREIGRREAVVAKDCAG